MSERPTDSSTARAMQEAAPATGSMPDDQALKEGRIATDVSPRLATGMILCFLSIIFGVPIAQSLVDIARRERVQAMDVLLHPPSRAANQKFEEALADHSHLRRLTQPWLQFALSRWGGMGNSNVAVGTGGWLYYLPGIESITGPGFLSADYWAHRRRGALDRGAEPPVADPRPGILQFHRDLNARGIHLILLPVPDKAALQPWPLLRVSRASAAAPVRNLSFGQFVEEMRQAGIVVFDPSPALLRPDDPPRFLKCDTHWTPQWMEQVATDLAEVVRTLSPAAAPPEPFFKGRQLITHTGDLAAMLRTPKGLNAFAPQTVEIHPVHRADGSAWTPQSESSVLLLGDSFTNIYSAASLEWGTSAGLAEQLGAALGTPVDVIARNDAGAYAARQMLAADQARGRERLTRTHVVIWEFAARELSLGDWRLIPLPPPASVVAPDRFFVADPGHPREVNGVIRARTPSPRPGAVPYKDHIMAIHLTDLQGQDGTPAVGEAVVYLWDMRNNVLQPAARLAAGERVKLRLQNWDDVSEELQTFNRTELSEVELQLAPANWGELTK